MYQFTYVYLVLNKAVDNRKASLMISDTPYINLIKNIMKRFKTEADSELGLIVISERDYKILFVNTSLLKFLNKQWTDLVAESVSSLLTIEDYNKLMHTEKQNIIGKLLGRSNHFSWGSIEVEHNNIRAVLNMHYLRMYVDSDSYDIIYGITSSPLVNNIKCATNTVLDPWINSFTRLMYTITDDYTRFWLFILGIITSIFIAQITVYISKPSFICADKTKPIEKISKVIKTIKP